MYEVCMWRAVPFPARQIDDQGMAMQMTEIQGLSDRAVQGKESRQTMLSRKIHEELWEAMEDAAVGLD
jgi:hypothetical protein